MRGNSIKPKHVQSTLSRLGVEMQFQGLTQTAFIKKHQLKPVITHGIFAGRTSPKFDQVFEIANLLGFKIGVIEKKDFVSIVNEGPLVRVCRYKNNIRTELKTIPTNDLTGNDLYQHIIENITPYLIIGIECRVQL